jgi:hypothetical protein
MSTIQTALAKFRQSPMAGRPDNPFRLRSSVSDPATPGEVDSAWEGFVVPAEARELWSECRSARLFEDADFGQWGLLLLAPDSSARRTAEERAARPADLRRDDVVVGAFLGDQELLVVAPSEAGSRRVLIALPLDPRADWFGVGEDLGQFLEAYFLAGGDKFWERAPQGTQR